MEGKFYISFSKDYAYFGGNPPAVSFLVVHIKHSLLQNVI